MDDRYESFADPTSGSAMPGYRRVFVLERTQSATSTWTAGDREDRPLCSGQASLSAITIAPSGIVTASGIVTGSLPRRIRANRGSIRSARTLIKLAGFIASHIRKQLW
jgi:hypothetical protein